MHPHGITCKGASEAKIQLRQNTVLHSKNRVKGIIRGQAFGIVVKLCLGQQHLILKHLLAGTVSALHSRRLLMWTLSGICDICIPLLKNVDAVPNSASAWKT